MHPERPKHARLDKTLVQQHGAILGDVWGFVGENLGRAWNAGCLLRQRCAVRARWVL